MSVICALYQRQTFKNKIQTESRYFICLSCGKIVRTGDCGCVRILGGGSERENHWILYCVFQPSIQWTWKNVKCREIL